MSFLRKLNLQIKFSLFFLVFIFCSCATEYNVATKKEEIILYSTDKEVRVGDSVAAKIEKNYTVVDDIDVNERVKGILDKIVDICDRNNIVYFIKVLEGEEKNAVSLPGGYIYIFQGLIDMVDNDDQLAGVIAHEVGHITARHGIKRLQNMYGALMLKILASQSPDAAVGVNLTLTSLFMAYSQEDEYLADRLSVRYMKAAGFDPVEMITFLTKIKENNEKAEIRRFSYWRTHPHPSKRIAILNKEITGKMEFRDYLKLTEEKF
jgi:predicted Zn-dependent protease